MRRRRARGSWAALALAAAAAVVLGLGCARRGSGGADAGELGRAVYKANCAVCHGLHGDGQGEAAPRLTVQARDFRSGRYKFRSTASGQFPTDEDLRRTIVHGLRGSSMVPQNHLGEAEVEAVIAVIKGFSPDFAQAPPPRPLKMPQRPDGATPDLERGKRIYHEAGCDGCHGVDGQGAGKVARDLSQAPANLTRRPLKGGSTAADILRTIVTGLDGTPMPSYHLLFDDADFWALADYVESLGGPEVMTDEEKLGWSIERRDPATGARPTR